MDSGFGCYEADRRSRTETAEKSLLLNKICQCPFKQTTLRYFQLAAGLCEFLLCSGFILPYSITPRCSHTLSFAAAPEGSLALSDLIPSVLPSWAGSSSPHAAPGRAEVSPVLSLHSGSHPTVLAAAPAGAARAHGRRTGCVSSTESFLYSSELTAFCGKPTLQIKARTILSEKF